MTPPPKGGQPAIPVAYSEEQDDHWPQNNRGAEGVIHPSASRRLSVRPQRLLLACIW